MTVHTVSGDEVRRSVPMSAAIAELRRVLIEVAEHGDAAFDMPGRQALADGSVLVMVARHVRTGTAVVKALSVQLNRQPAVVGTLSWLDPKRATPLVMEAEAVTTLRTGAIAGLATDLLADADADRMALVGSGAQAPDQVRAVHAVRPLRELRIVSRSTDNAQRLAALLRAELVDTRITATGTDSSGPDAIRVAVSGMPIVSCATSARDPVLAASDLHDQVHVNAIGSFRPSMRELPAELLAEAEVLAVEKRSAALAESGEVIHAVESGHRSEGDICELGELLRHPVRRSGRTVFTSVGTGIQDWTIAQAVAERVEAVGAG
ncbi:ornithine cyclodeaminase family protein [Lipingzhangella sp. LS1_29]|uniref:Ornithine cyclodeaminase family protein n=1 Tax=Lipingzhangella rawalii TaxID=2055835 RepID=A0ABU2H6R5_9ACTN|nr:ornithine cyclodeaminase family protein [Lipingzhangella rawalii]MDS1270319.1 ornithine cyclodeaminase family protein [Lipingzhangella rawalii]